MQRINNIELKFICVEILSEIDRVCAKYGLHYFANFGTLIGAVRHKGFIPWDDDVDVCMPRKDYEQFLVIMEKESKYQVMHDGNSENYYFNFARVYDPKTILEISGITELKDLGVFVDVFPLDNVPENEEERKKFFAEINELNAMVTISMPERLNRTIPIKKRIRTIMRLDRFVKCKILGPKKLIERRKAAMLRYEGQTAVISCMCPPDDRMTFESDIYQGTIEMPFENIMVKVPVNYDTILRKYYGDYMELPPENQRVSAHHFEAFFIKE